MLVLGPLGRGRGTGQCQLLPVPGPGLLVGATKSSAGLGDTWERLCCEPRLAISSAGPYYDRYRKYKFMNPPNQYFK